LIELLPNIGFFELVGLLEEHVHKVGLFADQLLIVPVDKEGFHNELVEAAETFLAGVEALSFAVHGLLTLHSFIIFLFSH